MSDHYQILAFVDVDGDAAIDTAVRLVSHLHERGIARVRAGPGDGVTAGGDDPLDRLRRDLSLGAALRWGGAGLSEPSSRGGNPSGCPPRTTRG
jgi:hypothetical protein